MNFKQWLNEATKDEIEALFADDAPPPSPPDWYIDPDTLYYDHVPEITFVYTNDGQLFEGDGPKQTHRNLIMTNKFLYKIFNPYVEQGLDYITAAGKLGLLGRIGLYYNKYGYIGPWKIASFWGQDKHLFDQLLVSCVQTLTKKRLLWDNKSLISTPFHKTVPVEQILNNSATNNHMNAEKYELYKKLHLMRGAEKQQAMKVLGVGGGGKPHPMATAMQQANLLKPGQKWWAPTSETNILSSSAAKTPPF